MGVKYIKRNGKTITIDTKTGKELKFGDRLKNKVRKGLINFSNKPFGLDYSKYKGTDQWDDKKKRFLTQNEVNKRDTSNLPNSKETSASIRGKQKKNDKSKNNLKINKEEKKVEKKVVVKKDTVKDNSKFGANNLNASKDPEKKTDNKAGKKKKSKFIKRKNGTLAKRGTVTARRAENREKARDRAKAAAKLRIQKKKK